MLFSLTHIHTHANTCVCVRSALHYLLLLALNFLWLMYTCSIHSHSQQRVINHNPLIYRCHIRSPLVSYFLVFSLSSLWLLFSTIFFYFFFLFSVFFNRELFLLSFGNYLCKMFNLKGCPFHFHFFCIRNATPAAVAATLVWWCE